MRKKLAKIIKAYIGDKPLEILLVVEFETSNNSLEATVNVFDCSLNPCGSVPMSIPFGFGWKIVPNAQIVRYDPESLRAVLNELLHFRHVVDNDRKLLSVQFIREHVLDTVFELALNF